LLILWNTKYDFEMDNLSDASWKWTPSQKVLYLLINQRFNISIWLIVCLFLKFLSRSHMIMFVLNNVWYSCRPLFKQPERSVTTPVIVILNYLKHNGCGQGEIIQLLTQTNYYIYHCGSNNNSPPFFDTHTYLTWSVIHTP
jgi:hypothetical protein